jgi:AcrR family transcriptional regulator
VTVVTFLAMNTRSPSRSTAEVRERILAAALDAFYTNGFHGASMRDIAATAGFSVANVYNHYANKADLLVEILHRASDDQLMAARAAVRRAGDDVPRQWSEAVAAHARFAAERPRECLVANSELRYLEPLDRKRVVGARDAQENLFAGLVAAGVQEGAFATPHPEQAVTATLTMCAGISLWFRPDGPLSPAEVGERYGRFALGLVECRTLNREAART